MRPAALCRHLRAPNATGLPPSLALLQRNCQAPLCCRAPACWCRASSSRHLHLLCCWAVAAGVPAAGCGHRPGCVAFLWCAAPAAVWAARLQGSLTIAVAVTTASEAIVAAAGVLGFLLMRAAPAVPLCVPVFRNRAARPAQQHSTGMAPDATIERLCAGIFWLYPGCRCTWPSRVVTSFDHSGCSHPCLSQASNPQSLTPASCSQAPSPVVFHVALANKPAPRVNVPAWAVGALLISLIPAPVLPVVVRLGAWPPRCLREFVI